MKKLLGLTITMILALPLMALAQNSQSSQSSTQNSNDAAQGTPTSGQNDSSMGQGSMGKTGHAAKSGAVKGTISQDGKSLVSDTDGKSWTIANPDAVKGHEGHHVELKGSTDASTGEIQVTSVKMLKGEKGAMKKDSSQQPQ